MTELWGPFAKSIGMRSFDWTYFRLYKAYQGFSPEYITRDVFDPWLVRSLNPARYVHSLNSKLAAHLYFYRLPRPVTHLMKLEDAYYDGEQRLVSENSAVGLLAGMDAFLIKPLFCFGGSGVRKINQAELPPDRRKAEAAALVREYPDFVVQEIIRQHPLLAELNPSSVNTIRVNTLFLNGKTSLCCACVKYGKAGAPVDNYCSGGSWAGLDGEGRFTGQASGKGALLEDRTPGGLPLAGRRIPHFDRLLGLVTEMHPAVFPMFHLAGWDVAINENGEPVVVEINFRNPVIQVAQMLTGPFFKERTREVIDYAIAHPFRSFTDELLH